MELVEGLGVRIQRSNGRIHLALVKKVDWSAGSVAVEWQRRTKRRARRWTSNRSSPSTPTSPRHRNNHFTRSAKRSTATHLHLVESVLERGWQPVSFTVRQGLVRHTPWRTVLLQRRAGRDQWDLCAGDSRRVPSPRGETWLNSELIPLCSYFEIYSEKLYDLLNGRNRLQILEDGKQQVQVVGLEEVRVSSPGEVLQLIVQGNRWYQWDQSGQPTVLSFSRGLPDYPRKATGRLHEKLSLTGSERGGDTDNSDRQTLIENGDQQKPPRPRGWLLWVARRHTSLSAPASWHSSWKSSSGQL